MGNTSQAAVPPYISVQQAAKLMGCTEIWVLRRLGDGTLPGFKLNGRAWAVDRKACEKDIAEYRSKMVTNRRGVGRPRISG
jgi:excisionase family DNA binding protein